MSISCVLQQDGTCEYRATTPSCAVGMAKAWDVDMCYILSYSIYLADGNRGVGCNGECGVDRSPFQAIWRLIRILFFIRS